MTEGAICLCSRGLIHSRTMESIERNLAGRRDRWTVLFTHDLPIPDAQNDVTERALRLQPTWLWFVEEDMRTPDGALDALLAKACEGFDAVAADYRMKNRQKTVAMTYTGDLIFAGMGCLLVRASVFERFERPYFRANRYSIDYGTGRAIQYAGEMTYGGQDVTFFVTCRQKGIPISMADVTCGHLAVKKFGEPHANHGCHEIAEL